ncbi:O-antigen ligase family protein [Prosthecobacter sp.]|uniref:O-antigen ligase family protein n=1 Tax=Prosthecobacter sp. TaxID=1965333 RepID=UPI001D1DF998|nr:O-antigen ligase family protein [Prosthecobacter sp.]MCB1277436.1 O-antigen ligase family protein [Prosthecobacter sp.]
MRHARMSAVEKRHERLVQLLILAALALLVPAMTKSLSWADDVGVLPFKPRDYTLLTLAAAGVMVMLNRPSICPPAFLMLLVPLLRVLDATFLQRFTITALGDHSIVVMSLLSNFLVTFTTVLLLSTESWRRVAMWVAVCTSLVCAGCVYYEWLGFEKFTRIDGRMAGFPEDPNDPPIIISLMLAVMFTLNRRFWWNVALIAVVSPAIALTLSRSGMAVYSCLLFCYMVGNLRQHYAGMLLIVAVSVPLAIGGIAILSETSTKVGIVTNKDTADRLKAIYELDFERIKSPERGKDLQDGWEAAGKKPMWGHGTGAGTSVWKPHNQVVSLWIDIGIFGPLLYVSTLFLLTFRSLALKFRGFYCLVPLWLFVPCSQILVESPHYWFTAAVCCNLVFSGRFRLVLNSPAKAAARPHTPLPQS